MKNLVYITTNLITDKKYVGSHFGRIDDLYLGSGNLIIRAIKKYGKQNFKREILKECKTIKQARNLESYFIKKYNTLFPNGYNISKTGGIGILGKSWGNHTEEVRKKLSKSHTGLIKSEITKERLSKSLKGKNTWTKGSKRSKEFCERAKQQMLGNRNGLGKKRSDNSKIKYSLSKQGKNNPMFGMYGNKNPNYDNTIYKFKNNNTNEIFEGTKFELAKRLGTISSSIKRVIDGKRLHYKKWIVIL